MNNWEFKNPWWLLLLFLVPFIWWLKKENKKTLIELPHIAAFDQKENFWPQWLFLLDHIKYVSFSLMVIAMARPRVVDISTQIDTKNGIDIMLTLDTSLSMLAKDLFPDRISALKQVCQDFVAQRKADRIGLVSYSGEALTKVPLTTDSRILHQQIERLEINELEPGTAIGIGLATSLHHLRKRASKSKIIILVTDGKEYKAEDSSINYVAPLEAAYLAKELGVKVYTIGVGTDGWVLFPGSDFLGRLTFGHRKNEFDESLLKEIAEITDGHYFRANDNTSLASIYEEIDQLEKSEIEEIKFYSYQEYFRCFLGLALFFLLMDFLLQYSLLKKLT